jgi:hypothetical protein
MKKVIALLILVITMVAVYAAAAELPLSTSGRGNQYYEANRGWGLCRTNDTTFFESTSMSAISIRWYFRIIPLM